MTEKDLRNILEDLGPKDFKDFKWYLKYEKVDDLEPIKESKLSEAERWDVVDLMVQKYELAGAVDVFKSILKAIDRNDLVRKLLNISSGAKGQSQEKTNITSHPDSSSVRRNSPDNQERVLQRKLHTFSLPPGELHLTRSQTNSPQNPKPTDQPSTSHSQIERLQNEVQIHISDKIRQAGGAGEKLLYHKTTQDSCDSSMTTGFNSRFAGQNRRKISIVVLGTEDYLKKSLISVILGKDVSVYSSTLNKTETYEIDTYEVIYTPNLYEASEEIKKVFSSKHPDMSVLVLKDKISTQEVQQQIENLHKTIGKHTDEFRVVLPLNHKREECYPDNCCTMEELFSRLRELAEQRHLIPTDKRSADRPPSYRASHSQMKTAGKPPGIKVNLVLLGMSGTGKSTSGNTILGKKQFLSRVNNIPSVRLGCQVAETEIEGARFRVIDTPDIFDDAMKSSFEDHVKQCKELCKQRPCVYVLVIQVSRFTDGERDILKKLEQAFGSEARKQTVILFTRGEDLKRAGMSLEGFLDTCHPDLKNIVRQCGNRCVVFDNKEPRENVKKLMLKVNRVLK